MKFLIMALFLGEFCAAQSIQSEFTQKRELHFFAAYAIDATVVQMLPASTPHRLLKSNLITIGLGLLKETFDSKFSTYDLTSDAYGIGAYSLVHFTFNF